MTPEVISLIRDIAGGIGVLIGLYMYFTLSKGE